MSDAPVFRGCPKCGGDLAAETMRGARALGCLHCDAVVLTRADLASLIENDAVTEEAVTQSGGYAIDTPTPAPRHPPSRRGGVHWAIVLTLAMITSAGGLVAGAAVVLVATKFGGRPAVVGIPDVPVLPAAVAGTPPSLPGVVPATPGAAAVVEQPAVAAIDPTAVPVDPAATPPATLADPAAAAADPGTAATTVSTAPPAETAVAAPPPKKRSALDRGWKAVDAGDLFAAKDAFEEAYRANPSNGEAGYALGYALFNLGKSAEAKDYLCEARTRPISVDTQREVDGLLRQIGTPCP